MIEQGSKLSELRALRKEFAPTRLGSRAFRIIAKGSPCVLKVEDVQCNARAIMTLDMDIPRIRDVELFPVCGEKHKKALIERIDEDYKKSSESAKGMPIYNYSLPGANGFFRGDSRGGASRTVGTMDGLGRR